MKITKAVIPVAGKGTRFLPATKQTPKEMLPIINIPMIHYVVEEAVKSGIKQIVFVTSSGKSSLEDYFDRNFELEQFLTNNNKESYKDLIEKIGSMVDIITVRQKEQLGLGHAILCAKEAIGSDDFAVLLGDDIVQGGNPVTKQLLEVYNQQDSKSVIGVMEVPNDQTNKYGVVDGDFLSGDDKTLLMKSMVEKPEPAKAPTNLATPGRYILTNEIFSCLKDIKRGVGGEYQLTDAINLLATRSNVYAHRFEGQRYDTGSIKGYLEATVDFALANKDYKEIMKEIILTRSKDL